VKLWVLLYAMIWIVFLEFLLAMTPATDRTGLLYAHAALGLVILVLAGSIARRLRATRVPGRVKRIAQATFSLAVVMATSRSRSPESRSSA
jgi:hypothetical protein